MTSLTPNQQEFKLQVKCVENINKCFDVFFFHIPNRPGDATDGYFKKMMGARAGASDLIFGWKGGVGLIELKARDGRLETAQNKFMSAASQIGWNTAICNSWKQVYYTLLVWGHTPKFKYNEAHEPDLHSWDEKRDAAIDFFRP